MPENSKETDWAQYAPYVAKIVAPLMERAELLSEMRASIPLFQERADGYLKQIEPLEQELESKMDQYYRSTLGYKELAKQIDLIKQQIANLQRDRAVSLDQVRAVHMQIANLEKDNGL